MNRSTLRLLVLLGLLFLLGLLSVRDGGVFHNTDWRWEKATPADWI